MQPLSEEQKSFLLSEYEKTQNYAEVTRRYVEHFNELRHASTIASWIKQLQREQLFETMYGDEGPLRHDMYVTRLKLERALYQKKYNRLVREEIAHEDLSDIIRSITPKIAPVTIPSAIPELISDSPLVAVAPITDAHVGEAVSAAELDGLNAYTLERFNARIWGWAHKVVELIELRRSRDIINEIIIPMLGDMVSGDIHKELTTTNIGSTMENMVYCAYVMAQAIMYIAQFIARVKVKGVVGNHGRFGPDIYYKQRFVNWDHMVYQWIAVFCQDQKNIEFEIPKTFWKIIDVAGFKVLIHHGDAMRANGSMQSKVYSFRQMLQIKNQYFDHMLMGHYHHVDEEEIGTGFATMCGCIKGPDEFATDKGLASPARHLLLFFHPEKGYITRENIPLQDFDNGPMFDAPTEEVWVNDKIQNS